MTTSEKIEVMQAHLEGKPIECRAVDSQTWEPAGRPSWDWIDFVYRVAQPKQLGPEDFPPGTVVRNKNWEAYQWKLIIAVSSHDITMMNGANATGLFSIRFDYLTPNWERSVDGGKTWLPC